MDPDAPRADLPPPDRGAWSEIAGSFFAHVILLALSALLVRPLGEVSLDAEQDPERYLPSSIPFLTASADPGETEPRVIALALQDPDEEEPAESRCGEENGGSMGHPEAAPVALRYGVQGPVDNPDPHVGHTAYATEVTFTPSFFLGLASSWGGDPRAPTAPWGRDDSLGNDAVSARGHMWADETGTAFGSPGAGMGRAEICATCGASGHGASLWGTAPGGPTGTELSFQASAARPLAR
jgi:hypothetical protein